MLNNTTTPIKPVSAISTASKIEELEQSIKSLKVAMDKLCDFPDYIVAEEFNLEIFDTICEMQITIAYLKFNDITTAA